MFALEPTSKQICSKLFFFSLDKFIFCYKIHWILILMNWLLNLNGAHLLSIGKNDKFLNLFSFKFRKCLFVITRRKGGVRVRFYYWDVRKVWGRTMSDFLFPEMDGTLLLPPVLNLNKKWTSVTDRCLN